MIFVGKRATRCWLAKCTRRQPNLIWQLSSFNFFFRRILWKHGTLNKEGIFRTRGNESWFVNVKQMIFTMWIQTIFFFPFRNTLLSFYFQVFYSPPSCSSFLIQFHNGANYANTALSIIIKSRWARKIDLLCRGQWDGQSIIEFYAGLDCPSSYILIQIEHAFKYNSHFRKEMYLNRLWGIKHKIEKFQAWD